MKCFRTYWHKSIALLITAGFIYVQATALTCGVGRMLAAQHHHSTCHHKNEQEHCCSDFTQAFFSAFAKSQTAGPEFSCKQPAVEFAAMNAPFIRDGYASPRGIIVRDFFYPPPRVPDIRIFIRSFQV